MPTSPVLEDIATTISAQLEQRGFKKSKLVWKRPCGEVLQVLALGEVFGGEIEADVGFVFDAIKKLRPDTVGLSVLGGVTVHHSVSIAVLARSKLKRFSSKTPGDMVALVAAIPKATAVLDRIEDAPHALAELDLDRGAYKLVRAQLEWVTGKKAASRATLKATAKEFSDRMGMSYPELAWRYLRQRL